MQKTNLKNSSYTCSANINYFGFARFSSFIIKTNFGIVMEWVLIVKFAIYKTKLINRKYGISNNRRYF